MAAGRHAPLWIYEPPDTAIHVPSVPEVREPDPELSFMLDPSEEGFFYALWDEVTVRKTGRKTALAGRDARPSESPGSGLVPSRSTNLIKGRGVPLVGVLMVRSLLSVPRTRYRAS